MAHYTKIDKNRLQATPTTMMCSQLPAPIARTLLDNDQRQPVLQLPTPTLPCLQAAASSSAPAVSTQQSLPAEPQLFTPALVHAPVHSLGSCSKSP